MFNRTGGRLYLSGKYAEGGTPSVLWNMGGSSWPSHIIAISVSSIKVPRSHSGPGYTINR